MSETRWVLRAEGRPHDVELPYGCAEEGAYRHALEWAMEIDAAVAVWADEDGRMRHVTDVRPPRQVRAERDSDRLQRAAEAICPVNRAAAGHRDPGEAACRQCVATAGTVLAVAGGAW